MTTSVINLATLTAAQGFVINGIDAGDRSGRVASAGDVNGDGIDDLIIGADLADPGGRRDAGESYVVFGTRAGFGASLELSGLNGANGFVINGIDSSDFSSRSVASAGDVNRDGFDDLIIGAAGGDRGGRSDAGESYVVFGKAAGFGASLELSSLNGTNGFVINGIDGFDRSGRSVASAGDVNGDGFGDVIIGALTAAPGGRGAAGESYVVFGKTGGFGTSLDLSTLNGTNGFILNGIDGNDQSGSSVASAGDVNGDGIDDLIIGAAGGDPGGRANAGESYVVFGTTGGFGASLDLSSLNGTNGFVINGIDSDDSSGFSVASAGDVNGDGIDDLLIGAILADGYAGESYVVFGRNVTQTGGFGASLELSSLNGTNGFVLNGIDGNDRSGRSVASAGDVNGDGIDDLIIGASAADPGGQDGAGESYVVFGKAGGFDASLDLSSLNGTNGFVINGIDSGDGSGFTVAAAGDVNGDGFDDLIIGALYADPDGRSGAGESYVIFGFRTDAPLGALADADAAANSVAEDAAIGATVGVTARAIDADDTVSYALTNNAGGLFAIDRTTGVVTVAGALDFESARSHSITVQATSDSGSQTLAFDILVSDVIERLAITGTAAKNRLIGTQADEAFTGGAGNDVMTGRGGSDLFVFGTETRNGVRETDQISDFGAGDLLDLGGVSIVREINSGGSTRLIVGDDRDVILLTGLADFDADTMLLIQ